MIDDVTVSRFWSKVDKNGPRGCWLWIGKKDALGYGFIQTQSRPHRKWGRAHRISYELLVGPIAEGLVIDHLCRVTGCVNPSHLEPVTQAENMRRGVVSIRRSETAKFITHCPMGHEYTEANTATYKKGTYIFN